MMWDGLANRDRMTHLNQNLFRENHILFIVSMLFMSSCSHIQGFREAVVGVVPEHWV
jgi:hypothetical protein